MDYSKYTVLVVDDVPLNVLLVTKMLTRYHFTMRTASDGLQALASIEEKKPDIVLLDLLMPNLDGFGVLQKVRSDKSLDDMRVVILSALNADSDIVKGFNAGANDFVTKPIIMERLYSCIDKQIAEIEGKTA